MIKGPHCGLFFHKLNLFWQGIIAHSAIEPLALVIQRIGAICAMAQDCKFFAEISNFGPASRLFLNIVI
jgi:hypothetical protein